MMRVETYLLQASLITFFKPLFNPGKIKRNLSKQKLMILVLITLVHVCNEYLFTFSNKAFATIVQRLHY
jgi:hypothetical protein